MLHVAQMARSARKRMLSRDTIFFLALRSGI